MDVPHRDGTAADVQVKLKGPCTKLELVRQRTMCVIPVTNGP